jgi:enoyl-CoA hydratase
MSIGSRLRVERPSEGVARIVLARPDRRNAQDPEMLYELDDAFATATEDASVGVIVLAADGPDFSSGHDLSSGFHMPGAPRATLEGGFGMPGAEGQYAFEREAYMGLCLRWRAIPKPTIAEVQGRVIAGGLMLVWPMDLIIAGESASFCDPVTAFGANGVEFFVHPWELGARKAKELLFTGSELSAREAAALGMVNRVTDDASLTAFTLELAERIARRPPFGLRIAKASVNHALDVQGLVTSAQGAFALHQVGHAHNLIQFGEIIDPDGSATVRSALKAARADGRPT